MHLCWGEAGGRGEQGEVAGAARAHSHDVGEHPCSPDVCGRADGFSLHHLRS